MPIPGRICLLVLAMVMTLGLLLEHPRPLAVSPPSHLPSVEKPADMPQDEGEPR
jgi:hypothetical protein